MQRNIVLFVDDEANILNSIRRAVIDEEYKAMFAGSAAKALPILEQEPVSVIVTDMRMPEMDGLTFLKIVKEKYPAVVRMVLSGYTVLPQILATVNQADVFKFITKPWNMEDDLLRSVRQAVDYYNMQQERATFRDMLENRNAAYQKVLHKMEDTVSSYKQSTELLQELTLWKKQFQPATTEQASLLQDVFYQFIEALPVSKADLNADKLLKMFEKWSNSHDITATPIFAGPDPAACKLPVYPKIMLLFIEFFAAKMQAMAKEIILTFEINPEQNRLVIAFQIHLPDTKAAVLANFAGCFEFLSKLCAAYESRCRHQETDYGLLVMYDMEVLKS
ncbi:Hypothetical protein LUCI_2322 [Lucifera butyrica]|uniref:Response regulatory domain-containing protein n=1 Tax=Lucifera butyrica TaxID=1351585 RepID=A0A498RD23_9FIRM|nr:response regulator [Lucifera butyrica]VBB07078.1 Hypothetical protein LUCI_2322 [Lucifera butyrica]